MNNKYQRDEEYLKRIKSGDEALVKQLFLEYRAPFIGFFLKKQQLDRETVFDIYLKSYTILFEKTTNGELAPPLECSLQSFVISIGKNQVMQYWDKKKRDRLDLKEDLELSTTQQFLAPVIDQSHDDEALKIFVKTLLGFLNEKCRELLTLKYLKGFAYDAIAERLGIASENAARQQTFQCLEKLRSLMKKKGLR